MNVAEPSKPHSRSGRPFQYNDQPHPDLLPYEEDRLRRFGKRRGGLKGMGGFGGAIKLVLLGGIVYYAAKGMAYNGRDETDNKLRYEADAGKGSYVDDSNNGHHRPAGLHSGTGMRRVTGP
ncbi:hypothetical protein ACLMJK_009440 [Lecanora helva]